MLEPYEYWDHYVHVMNVMTVITPIQVQAITRMYLVTSLSLFKTISIIVTLVIQVNPYV